MAEPAAESTPEATQQAGAPAETFRRAIDELMGDGDVVQAEPAKPAGAPGEGDKAAKTEQETTPEPEENDVLRELKVFTRAQDRFARDRERLANEAQQAKERAKQEFLAALDSDDPDGALEQLGLPPERRRAIVQRLVLRHVPPEKADPALRAKIENDQLRAEVRSVKQAFEAFVKQQTEERVKERQATEQRKAAEAVLETLSDAFRNAPDEHRYARNKFSKRREATLGEAIQVGKELAAKGRISTKMSEPEIARLIVKELNARYRDDFGLADDAPSSTSAASAQAAAALPPKVQTKNAAEVSAARTISRGATEVTRPPPAQSSPLDDDEFLAEEAALFAKARREGKFSRA
jgi:hypothetical protein